MADVELLAGIRSAAAQRTREAAELYEELVRSAAAGETGDPDEALELIAAAGRDVAQFEADVWRLSQRIRDAATLATLPAAEGRYRAAVADVDAVLAEFETARAQFEKRELAARAKVEGAFAELREVEEARGRLIRTADQATERSRRLTADAIARQEAELGKLQSSLDRINRVADQKLKLISDRPGDAQTVATREAHNAEVLAARRRAEELQTRIAAVTKQIAGWRTEMLEAEQAKLCP